MKILLTGASGLIGKHLGALLVENGHEVVSLSRSRESALRELPFASQVIEWKQGQGLSLQDQELLKDLSAVINLMGAGLTDQRWTEAFKKELELSRVDATRELMKEVYACSNPGLWIQGSAIGFYGESKTSELKDEYAPNGEGFLAQLCDHWEETTLSLPTHVRKVLLRTGVVFSHQGGAFPKMMTPLLLGVGGVIGDGNALMSLVHLDDVARFVLYAIGNEKVRGAFNLVANEPIAQKDLVKGIVNLLKLSLSPPTPVFALRLMFGEMADLLVQSQAIISKRFQEVGFELHYPTNASIIEECTAWHRHPDSAEKGIFIQTAEQFVPKPLSEIFEFFSNAKNLEVLTPEFLHFKILDQSTPVIETGTKIRYQLKLHGIPFHWTTEIAVWNPPKQFVDNQLSGPYSLWYHEHEFVEVKGGTLLRDWVRFQLPGGKLGSVLGITKVRADVEKIFAYRREKIRDRFGPVNPSARPHS